MTIKNVLDKFDDEFILNYNKTGLIMENSDKQRVNKFLQDNLTLMLESLEEEVLDHMEKIDKYAKESLEDPLTVNEAHFAYAQLKEVINIINSHK